MKALNRTRIVVTSSLLILTPLAGCGHYGPLGTAKSIMLPRSAERECVVFSNDSSEDIVTCTQLRIGGSVPESLTPDTVFLKSESGSEYTVMRFRVEDRSEFYRINNSVMAYIDAYTLNGIVRFVKFKRLYI